MSAREDVNRLHRKANAQRWGVTPERFAGPCSSRSLSHAFPRRDAPADAPSAILRRSISKTSPWQRPARTGNEAAWEHFIREHRPVLYRAADAIDRTGGAREAADGCTRSCSA